LDGNEEDFTPAISFRNGDECVIPYPTRSSDRMKQYPFLDHVVPGYCEPKDVVVVSLSIPHHRLEGSDELRNFGFPANYYLIREDQDGTTTLYRDVVMYDRLGSGCIARVMADGVVSIVDFDSQERLGGVSDLYNLSITDLRFDPFLTSLPLAILRHFNFWRIGALELSSYAVDSWIMQELVDLCGGDLADVAELSVFNIEVYNYLDEHIEFPSLVSAVFHDSTRQDVRKVGVKELSINPSCLEDGICYLVKVLVLDDIPNSIRIPAQIEELRIYLGDISGGTGFTHDISLSLEHGTKLRRLVLQDVEVAPIEDGEKHRADFTIDFTPRT